MWRTCSGELETRRASRPRRPLPLVASSTLCQVEKLSSWVQPCQRDRQRALVAAGLELGGRKRDLGPGGWRFAGVDAGGLEGVFVDVEHRRRAVEREAQHLAVRRRVVAGHRRDVGSRVELVASILHDLSHRHGDALAGHHRRSADLEHLQDVRRLAGAIGRHGGGERHVVRALVGRHDLVLFLAGVEILGQVVDPLVVDGRHRVPPLDFGLSLRGARCGQTGQSGCSEEGVSAIHEISVEVGRSSDCR